MMVKVTNGGGPCLDTVNTLSVINDDQTGVLFSCAGRQYMLPCENLEDAQKVVDELASPFPSREVLAKCKVILTRGFGDTPVLDTTYSNIQGYMQMTEGVAIPYELF